MKEDRIRKMMIPALHLCCFASGLLLWGTGTLSAQQQSTEVEHGSYAIHSLLHNIGREEYATVRAADGVRLLTTSSSLDDRGSHRSSTVTLVISAAGQPTMLTLTTTNAKSAGTTSRKITIPAESFGAFLSVPAAVQMEMIRYWESHGQPANLPVLRAAEGSPETVSLVHIRPVGHDFYKKGSLRVRLTRYTVDGLLFGREIVWMTDSNRLAAIMTFAGGLPQEEILDEYAGGLGSLFHSGVTQEMLDLAELTAKIKPQAHGSYAIVGARLVDGTGAPAIEHSTVVIRDGRIVSAGSGAPPRGMRTVHAEGQTLLPGLWEMHAHYSGVEFGPALLSAGITTARDCGGELQFLLAVRRAIDKQHQLGPHLLLAGLIDSGGPLAFGSADVETSEQARSVVDLYAREHFQQIKVYTQIQPDVLRAISREAHAHSMTVTGHVPAAVNAFEGIADGMDQINHLGFVTQSMLPPEVPGSPRLAADRLPDLHSERAKSLIALLAAKHIVVDDTQSWTEMASHPRALDPDSFEPGLKEAPFVLAAKFHALGSATAADTWREAMQSDLDVLAALHKAGVPIVAGSDTGLLGFGLDRELELYVQAGFTPMQAIQAATLVPAQVMGLAATTGTVEPGKCADLVLVAGNPLETISAIRNTVSVVTAGRMYSTKAMSALVGFNRQAPNN
ncbi:MAG: amidohydrolase family protein [Janthinobacterium lividum]